MPGKIAERVSNRPEVARFAINIDALLVELDSCLTVTLTIYDVGLSVKRLCNPPIVFGLLQEV